MKTKTNMAFIYKTKGKNPVTDEWDYATLTPALKDQQGETTNYVIVCCEPSKNGIYKYTKKPKNFPIWKNGKLNCIYLPISECTFISFDDAFTEEMLSDPVYGGQRKAMKNKIMSMQDEWWKGEVLNHDAYKRSKPDWMLK